MPSIRLEQVAKIYKNSKRGVSGTLQADLTIRQGDFVFVTGPQGSGKSTMMELLAGELEPDHGKVWLGGADLWSLRRSESEDLRGCMGVVLSDDDLRQTETVFKNLASARQLEYLKNRIFDRRKIEKALSLVGLPGRGGSYPTELTPSERCRALLARAIWRSPSILVLDGLAERADDDTVWDMLHLLGALNKLGTTVVFATADSSYTTTMNKRVVNLFEGRITNGTQR
ncbi:MAG: ATP-binding cassette domain-containing protein [Oscillospiraceae bacterium]|nr:ATP-binding cassette domain-containing protein [Oscillospiraceae bacterium]